MRRQGVTQQDIAEFVGRRPETLSKWMNGRTGEFSIGMAIKMKDHFFPGCSVEYLFAREPWLPSQANCITREGEVSEG